MLLYEKNSCSGVGYVGLVTGTCLAELGNEVVGVDIDKSKIDGLNHGIIPIYEQGLEELVKGKYFSQRLTFTVDADRAIKREAEIVLLRWGLHQCLMEVLIWNMFDQQLKQWQIILMIIK